MYSVIVMMIFVAAKSKLAEYFLQFLHRYQLSSSVMKLPVVQHYPSLPSIVPSEEDTDNFSEDCRSDEGEEVWEESDESCTEECPELPSDISQTSTIERGILLWLLIFLLRLQAKYYNTRCCPTMSD